MTDRLHSCRESPTGRHDPMAYTVNGMSTCRYCGLAIRMQPLPETSPDAHLGTVNGE